MNIRSSLVVVGLLAGGGAMAIDSRAAAMPSTQDEKADPSKDSKDIDQTVDALVERGVEMERFEGFDHDDRGIVRGSGPTIAWFRDPAGNILSVVENV